MESPPTKIYGGTRPLRPIGIDAPEHNYIVVLLKVRFLCIVEVDEGYSIAAYGHLAQWWIVAAVVNADGEVGIRLWS